MNYRKIHDTFILHWKNRNTSAIPNKLYKHHIIPRHEDSSSKELVLVTIREHAFIHRLRYKITGTTGNYVAWKCISGIMPKEDLVLHITSMAGKIGGTSTRARDSGIFSDSWDRSKHSKALWASGKLEHVRALFKNGTLGRLGAAHLMAHKMGIHDPKLQHLRHEWAIMGADALNESGNRGGCCTSDWSKENKDAHQESSSRGGIKGGPITGKRYWWNNGSRNIRSDSHPGEGWVRGMLMSEKKRLQVMSIAGHNRGSKTV